MNRAAVLILSGLCIIIVVTASLVFTLYYSWNNAKEYERDKLYAVSKTTIHKARVGLDQIFRTLNALDKLQHTPCSEDHLKAMRNMAFNQFYVNDIEYLENNIVKCSASGLQDNSLSLFPIGYTLANGVMVLYNIPRVLTNGNNYIGLRQNNYNILINPSNLTDVAVDPYIKIALLTKDGHLLSSLNSPDPNLIQLVQKDANIENTKDELITFSKMPNFDVIVSESLSYVMKKWRNSLLVFMPFGLIMALLASGIIIYFSKRRLSLHGELKIALEKHEFVNYYQPIIDFNSKACIGAEALIRWRRPDGTMVRPDLFIPSAEESGLILPITDQVLQSIVNDLKAYFVADRNLHVSINVDVRDFVSGRIFSKLESCLEGTGIERQQIWLEITERGLMDIAACAQKITRAREAGYVIVIDDFGTGYSSLSYLQGLPLDVLKIDKSFINAVATDSVTSNVTHHIIEMSKSLNLKIIAEGIETKEQAHYLNEKKVNYAQGWLYAKAMPIDEFIAFYLSTNQKLIGHDTSNSPKGPASV